MPAFQAWLTLARIPNLPTVWSNCFAAWLLAGGVEHSRLGLSITGGSLAYIGGMFLNDYCDAKFDQVHRPERPIPSGQVRKGDVLLAGILCLAAGVFALGLSGAPGIALALGFLIVLYDGWHKANPLAPLLMAGCRVLLFAASGAREVISARVWLAAIGLGLYILAISVIAKKEFLGQKRAGSGAACLCLAIVLVPAAAQTFPPWWSWLLVLPILAVAIASAAGRSRNLGGVVALLLAAIPLLDAFNVNCFSVSYVNSALFLLLFIASRFLQRFAAAS